MIKANNMTEIDIPTQMKMRMNTAMNNGWNFDEALKITVAKVLLDGCDVLGNHDDIMELCKKAEQTLDEMNEIITTVRKAEFMEKPEVNDLSVMIDITSFLDLVFFGGEWCE